MIQYKTYNVSLIFDITLLLMLKTMKFGRAEEYAKIIVSYDEDRKEIVNNGVLVVDIVQNNANFCVFHLRSDVETATATLNKQNHNLVLNGFEKTLEYLFPLAYLKERLICLANLKTEQTHFCFGNG